MGEIVMDVVMADSEAPLLKQSTSFVPFGGEEILIDGTVFIVQAVQWCFDSGNRRVRLLVMPVVVPF